MKRIKITILFAMVVLFIPFLSQAAEPGPRTITVVGESTVKVAPDNVLISLTVETINPDLKVARSENNSKIKSVLELCKKENIESDNIKTSQISVSPKYKY